MRQVCVFSCNFALYIAADNPTNKISPMVPTKVQNNTPPPRHQHACLVMKSSRSFVPSSTDIMTIGKPERDAYIIDKLSDETKPGFVNYSYRPLKVELSYWKKAV